MTATIELQIAQICVAAVQVISLWILVFFAVNAWRKGRMTEYEYHMLRIGLKEGQDFPILSYRRAARYADRYDRANAAMWRRLIRERLHEVRRKAMAEQFHETFAAPKQASPRAAASDGQAESGQADSKAGSAHV